jgi:hypothetical protein
MYLIRPRMKALTLLMRYSGLRIGDAVTCSRDRLVGSKLFLYHRCQFRFAVANSSFNCKPPPECRRARHTGRV